MKRAGSPVSEADAPAAKRPRDDNARATDALGTMTEALSAARRECERIKMAHKATIALNRRQVNDSLKTWNDLGLGLRLCRIKNCFNFGTDCDNGSMRACEECDRVSCYEHPLTTCEGCGKCSKCCDCSDETQEDEGSVD